MPTYRLTIEYDGTKFSGWQVQLRHRTVQGVLVAALREVLGDNQITLQGAGRTDAGVHALGQVASLRCPRPLAVGRVLSRLDRALPSDLAVRDIQPAADSFHARHDAVARCYRYQLIRRPSAFGKRFTWWVGADLDVERLRTAAAQFVGRHDFAAFARSGHEAPSTIVVVDDCRVWDEGDVVILRLIASHFLWGQARRMVGALVAMAGGTSELADVRRWLDGSAPVPEPAAPASGLFLEAVFYCGDSRSLPPPIPIGVPWPAADRASGRADGTAEERPEGTPSRGRTPAGSGRGRRDAPRRRRR